MSRTGESNVYNQIISDNEAENLQLLKLIEQQHETIQRLGERDKLAQEIIKKAKVFLQLSDDITGSKGGWMEKLSRLKELTSSNSSLIQSLDDLKNEIAKYEET